MEVEKKRAEDVSCIFCPSIIAGDELKRLARKDTLQRYNTKLQSATTRLCQNRCNPEFQNHDPAHDGRVFTCQYCSFETCTTCDRPEHIGQTCAQYTATTIAPHAAEEAANETILTTDGTLKRCPGCTIFFSLESGCGYTQCEACGFRFCANCLVPWVGEGSVYMLGTEAHQVGCKYLTRSDPTVHGLKHRIVGDEEALEAHRERKRVRREARGMKNGGEKLQKEVGVQRPRPAGNGAAGVDLGDRDEDGDEVVETLPVGSEGLNTGARGNREVNVEVRGEAGAELGPNIDEEEEVKIYVGSRVYVVENWDSCHEPPACSMRAQDPPGHREAAQAARTLIHAPSWVM
ncbi:hypothetical protein MBLNU230_g3024t1 [Neophaeotheca triangularis]